MSKFSRNGAEAVADSCTIFGVLLLILLFFVGLLCFASLGSEGATATGFQFLFFIFCASMAFLACGASLTLLIRIDDSLRNKAR